MEVKSVFSLSNPYKLNYVKEKLDTFGKVEGLNFDYQFCKTPEQIISFLQEKIIDCAIVDVKNYFDLELDFLDWFFVNIYEDYDFDVLVSNKNNENFDKIEKIGVLSISQWLYCKKRFHTDNINFIKAFKNINELLTEFDLVMLPGYFTNQIGNHFYKIEKINIIDLQKPSFEGASCVIFRKGDERFLFLRQFFIKSVYFIGAGIGDKKYATYEAIRTIKNLDVCLFDNLMDHSLLDYLPEDAILIDVGKRCEHHKLNQAKITDLISMYARMGYRVGRLKGGDPSIFGRLAEEIKVLEDLRINFHIIPGISTINALSIKSGIILTRREINRGFCVLSAIKHKGATAEFNRKELDSLPLIFFMGVRVIGKISSSLINDGYLPHTKVAVVFCIGTEQEFEIRGTLSDIASKINDLKGQLLFDNPPGIFIVGEISNFFYQRSGLLQDKKILVPTPFDDKLYFSFKDIGVNLFSYNLNIKYKITKEILEKITSFQAIAISHAKLAKALMETLFEQKKDIRTLPQLITQSDNVFNFFKHYGLYCVKDIDSISGLDICFIYNNNYCMDLLKLLSQKNKISSIKIEGRTYKTDVLTAFDMIYFECIEQYYEFVDLYGVNSLKDKIILSIDKSISTLITSKKNQSFISIFDKTNFKFNIPRLLNFLKK